MYSYNRRPKHTNTKLGQNILQQCLANAYQRMVELLNTVPENADLDTNEDALAKCNAVWAIEEEWILDPELREHLSLIDCKDSSDS